MKLKLVKSCMRITDRRIHSLIIIIIVCIVLIGTFDKMANNVLYHFNKYSHQQIVSYQYINSREMLTFRYYNSYINDTITDNRKIEKLRLSELLKNTETIHIHYNALYPHHTMILELKETPSILGSIFIFVGYLYWLSILVVEIIAFCKDETLLFILTGKREPPSFISKYTGKL